jgi:hypothetical protein
MRNVSHPGSSPATETIVLPYLDWAEHAVRELSHLGYLASLHQSGDRAWTVQVSGPPGLMERLRRAAAQDGPQPNSTRFEWAPWIGTLDPRAPGFDERSPMLGL